MNNDELLDDPELDKKLNISHKHLLLDEEFQQIRTSILRSLDKDKQPLLRESEIEYISEKPPSPHLEKEINRKYQQWIKKIPKKESLFSRIFSSLNLDNKFNFSLTNAGMVATGILIGIFLSPEKVNTKVENHRPIYTAKKGQGQMSLLASNNHLSPKIVGIDKQEQINTSQVQLTSPVSSIESFANQSIHNTQPVLPKMFESILNAEQDDEIAFIKYKLAAEKGEFFAQNKLGIMYKNGWGIKKDEELALHWFNEAAKNGSAEAKYNLAVLYFDQKRTELANKLLKESAQQGYKRAQFTLKQHSNIP